jgi:hypothetical protein
MVANTGLASGAAGGSADVIRERLVGAFGQYLQTLQGAFSTQAEKVAAPYQDFYQAINKASVEPKDLKGFQTVYLDQTKRLLDQLGKAGPGPADDVRCAYDAYVKSVAGILTEATADNLPPQILAGLGQHLVAVSLWAAAADASCPFKSTGGSA